MSAHLCHEFSGYGKSQTNSSIFSVPAAVHLVIGIFQCFDILRPHTDSGILHADHQIHAVLFFSSTDKQYNTATFREFHRIIHQMENHTVDLVTVAKQTVRKICLAIHNQFQILLFIPRGSHVYHIVNHRCNIIRLEFQFYRIGFQFGKVQNIGYQ